MQPLPAVSGGPEGFRPSHPLLLVVASDESKSSTLMQNGSDGLTRDGHNETQPESILSNCLYAYMQSSNSCCGSCFSSTKAFYQKIVKILKDMNFLQEDLVFSIHNEVVLENGEMVDAS